MNRLNFSDQRLKRHVWLQRSFVAAIVVLGLTGEALANDPPVLTSFTARKLEGPNNVWEFSGTVEDEFVEGCSVVIDGGPLFGPETVAVNPNGTFRFSIALEPDSSGWVIAVATDQMGLESNEKKEFVG